MVVEITTMDPLMAMSHESPTITMISMEPIEGRLTSTNVDFRNTKAMVVQDMESLIAVVIVAALVAEAAVNPVNVMSMFIDAECREIVTEVEAVAIVLTAEARTAATLLKSPFMSIDVD